jgi:hypothetical protein
VSRGPRIAAETLAWEPRTLPKGIRWVEEVSFYFLRQSADSDFVVAQNCVVSKVCFRLPLHAYEEFFDFLDSCVGLSKLGSGHKLSLEEKQGDHAERRDEARELTDGVESFCERLWHL